MEETPTAASTGLLPDRSSRVARFFDDAHRAFQDAVRATARVERFYSIGPYVVRLEFAGPALVPLVTPALEHLAHEPVSDPALTVCVWDRVGTDTEMPRPAWQRDDFVERGRIRGFNDRRFQTAYQMGMNVLSMLDHESNLALYWTDDADGFSYHEQSFPLRTILKWWMLERGYQLVHAAGVGTPDGGVLIAGKSGTGKSTAALACLRSDLLYLGDDHLLLGQEPRLSAYSVYSSAKLHADQIGKLPFLRPLVTNASRLDREKALLFLKPHYRDRIVRELPVRAILVPLITERTRTRIRRASRAAALRALAPSTMFLMPGSDHQVFRTLASVVRKAPTYFIELGTDLTTIPDSIARFLAEEISHFET